MRPWIVIAAAGAFGGSASLLLELAARAYASQLPGGGYYIALALFGVIGSGMALIQKETAVNKAFLLGVSAPALIQAAGKGIDQSAAARAPAAEAAAWPSIPGVGTAHAQEVDVPSPGPGAVAAPGTLEVVLGPGATGAYALGARHCPGSTAGCTLGLREASAPGGVWSVAVPGGTAGLYVEAVGRGARVDVPEGAARVALSVVTEKSIATGFYQALQMDAFAARSTSVSMALATERWATTTAAAAEPPAPAGAAATPAPP